MDEKDFSLDSLNSSSKPRDSVRPMDDSLDISFAGDDKRSPLPSDEDAAGADMAAPDEISYEDDAPAEYDEKPVTEAAEDRQYTDEADGREDLDSADHYTEGFGDDYSDGNSEDAPQSGEEDDSLSEPVEGLEPPAVQDDLLPEDEEEEEEDITLSPSATNGVTDFSEPRRSPRPSSRKKKKRKSRVNNSIFGALILVTIILTVSLVVAITGIKIGMEYLGVGKSEDDITFNIPENATPDDICDILISNNIIENKTLFKIAMKLQHSPTLFPGDVTLHPSMGYSTIIEELSKQRDIRKTVTLTFQEGITLLEAANMLEEKKVCTAQDFLFEFNKKQGFAFENQIDDSADTFYKMEGFFFPDTYEFYVNDTGYNVSRTVKSNFASKYTESIQKAMGSTKLSLYEVITLASIVQWEANSAKDMPKVASVFLNRLADPDTFPKLQSDATGNYLKKVINVVGDTASKERYADIYDTYVCTGLPSGPVCNPGLDAIKAVTNPEKTKYYYFCNNLKTGKSYFAETLEQHQKNLVKAGLA